MGKWAEVHCNCPNRVPLAGSDPYFGKPHYKKHRLTKKERQEVEEWQRTTKNMFACGHRGGTLIELSPEDIIHLGNLIGSIFPDENSAFELFVRVGDWRCYEAELLLIQPDEAGLWLMEIEEIQHALQGFGNLPQVKTDRLLLEFYRDDLGSRLELERRLDEITAKNPILGGALRQNVERSTRPDLESTAEKIVKALEDAAKLCHTSIETGNPIRLLW